MPALLCSVGVNRALRARLIAKMPGGGAPGPPCGHGTCPPTISQTAPSRQSRFFLQPSVACAAGMITKLIMASTQTATASPHVTEQTVLKVLLAMSFSHLLNDTIQSLLPAIYPLLKENYHLTFTQVGLITLTFQVTASLLQPVVGSYTDRKPKPYSLAAGMGITLCGLILLSRATDYRMILVSAAMVGMGSSIFHPEASRIAHMAAGGRHGFAQSLFQVGGNLGSSLGPIAGLFIVAHGQTSIICQPLGVSCHAGCHVGLQGHYFVGPSIESPPCFVFHWIDLATAHHRPPTVPPQKRCRITRPNNRSAWCASWQLR